MLAILNDILDFSKVESGKLELDDTPFRLDELLRNLSVVLSSTLQHKAVEVLFSWTPPCRAHCVVTAIACSRRCPPGGQRH